MIKAQEQAKLKEQAAAQMKEKAESVKERRAGLEKAIELEKSLLDTMRKKADNAYALQGTLKQALDKKLADKVSQEEIQAAWSKVSAADQDVADIRGRGALYPAHGKGGALS